MKRATKIAAIAAAAVLLFTACGQAPTTAEPTATPDATEAATPAPDATDAPGGTAVEGFLPCIISDGGGFNDRSFNQSGLEGLQKAAAQLGVNYIQLQSQSDADFAPNIQSAIDQGCNFVVTIGFQLASATEEAAAANPDIHFAIVDNDSSAANLPNLKSLVFNTAEAAFLAGYLSAGMSQTGVIGTFGGMNFPTVSVFMDGFAQGADHYNEVHGTSVRVVGWDRAAQDGSFTGGFQANEQARQTAQTIIDQNVDVLLPVGGPIYQSAMAAINDSGRDILLLGVDQDFFFSDPTTADILLTSVLKDIVVAVSEATIVAGTGGFAPTTYIGTLENGGVGIAPFHNLADRVPADLAAEIEQLKADIIAGNLTVESYLKP